MSPTQELYLLDSNIVLLLVRGGEIGARIAASFALKEQTFKPLVSAISHGELFALALRNGWGDKKLRALRDALHQLVTVPVDAGQVTDCYAAMRVHTHAAGTPMSENDLWIAATAMASGATLLSMDGDHEALGGTELKLIRVSSKTGGALP